MINKISENGKKVYNLCELVCDEASDVTYLSTDYAVGSTAFVIETKKTYMLNGFREWVEI